MTRRDSLSGTDILQRRPVLLKTPSRSFGQYRLVTELAYRPGHKLHLVYTCSLHDRALAFYAVHIIIATQSLLLRIFQSLAGKAQPSDICNNSCASSSGTQLIAVVLLSWSMQVSTSPDTSYRTRSCLVVPTTGTYEDGTPISLMHLCLAHLTRVHLKVTGQRDTALRKPASGETFTFSTRQCHPPAWHVVQEQWLQL